MEWQSGGRDFTRNLPAFPRNPAGPGLHFSMAESAFSGRGVSARARKLQFIFVAGLLAWAGAAQADPEDSDVTLLAVGDIMMARHIGKIFHKKGGEHIFQKVSPLFQEADIAFCNLESVLGEPQDNIPFAEKPFNFRASTECAQALADAGFDVVSMANNHAMDYGPRPIQTTRALLADLGLQPFGAGKDLAEATTPALMDVKDTRVIFLGYAIADSSRPFAGRHQPGMAPIDVALIRRDIRKWRDQADVLIVSMHWGLEYHHEPSPTQRAVARKVIDAGADMILGHHPHVLEGLETYKGKTIVYSMGNFVFDQKQKADARESMMVRVTIHDKKISAVETVPVDKFEGYLPKPAEGASKDAIAKNIAGYSLLAAGKRPASKPTPEQIAEIVPDIP